MGDRMTKSIRQVKTAVALKEWQGQIIACQESGMSVTEWCSQNGIPKGTYYGRLRKVREAAIEEEGKEIVPIKPAASQNIRISAGEISISLPENANVEQLAAIIGALKTC